MAALQLGLTSAKSHPLVCPSIRQSTGVGLTTQTPSANNRRQLSTSARSSSARRLSVSAIVHPAAGGRNWSVGSRDTTVDLCIFPMWSMPLPTSTGSLNVFEPHLMALLQVVQQVAAASLDNIPARFGTLPYDWVQHQMWLEDSVVPPSLSYLGDVPPPSFADLLPADKDVVGVSCDIEGVIEEPGGNGSLVKYHATRRFKPMQILRRKPFLVVRGAWLDDERGKASSLFEGKSTDKLEQDVWQEMQEVVKYTAKLQGRPDVHLCGGPDAALPETVCKLSPVAPPKPTTAEERVKALTAGAHSRMPAEVAVWRQMRSATPVAPEGVVEAGPIMADPYLAASERISQAGRQESFSFAAANLVELGPEQRKELLGMTSTAQRLHWLLQAIEPHLGALRAEYAMRQALGDL